MLGGILTAFGWFADKSISQRSLGININLWWGLVMLIFGLAMLRMGGRAASAARSAKDSPTAQKLEQNESLRDRADARERPHQ